ncbi:MAG TPA: PspC domain-containing protein [Lapillicoccus sp.]|nr:PspC domain-containing protein [Lapillicoccus sp.]
MTSTPATTPTPALDRFFDSLRRSSVTRSQDRVIAGVCSGIAQRFGISPAIVRVGAVVLAFFGPGVFIYLLAWLMLPRYDGQVRLERAVRGGEASSIVLLIVTLLAIVPDLFGHWRMGPWPLIGLAILAVVGFKKGWWGQHRNHGSWHQATTPQASTTAPTAPTTPTAPTSTPPSEGPQDAPRV